jgi:hypothetical protein
MVEYMVVGVQHLMVVILSLLQLKLSAVVQDQALLILITGNRDMTVVVAAEHFIMARHMTEDGPDPLGKEMRARPVVLLLDMLVVEVEVQAVQVFPEAQQQLLVLEVLAFPIIIEIILVGQLREHTYLLEAAALRHNLQAQVPLVVQVAVETEVMVVQ